MDKKNLVITISREFGSGGRMIGEALAERLGITFYDKTLIDMVARKSGLAPEFIMETEKSVTKSFLFNVAVSGYYPSNFADGNKMPIADQVFALEAKIIRQLSEEESCVIVGRCADYILEKHQNAVHAFIYSDAKSKVDRAVNSYGIASDKAKKECEKRDKARAGYYNYYTGQKWGYVNNYHIALYSDFIGIENCVTILEGIAKERL